MGKFRPRTVVYLAFALIFLFGSLWDGGTGHGGAWLVRLSLLGFCLSLGLLESAPKKLSLSSPFIIFSVLLVACSLLGGPYPPSAIQLLIRLGFALALYMALRALGPVVHGPVVAVFVGVGGVHAIWSLLEAVLATGSRISGGFFNANHCAAFLLPATILLLCASFRSGAGERGYLRPWQQNVLYCGFGLAVLATQSRMGLLVLALCSALALAALTSKKWRKSVCSLFFLSFLLAAYFLLPRFLGQHDPNAYGRFAIWQSTTEIVAENPFGVGVGHAASALRIHGVEHGDLVRYAHVARHSHSEFFNMFLELGWPGLFILTAFLFYLAFMHWKIAQNFSAYREICFRYRWISFDSPWAMAAVSLAFILPALTSNTWHVAPIAYFMVCWLAFVEDIFLTVSDSKIKVLESKRWFFSLKSLAIVAFLFASAQAAGHYALMWSGDAQKSKNLEKAERYATLATTLRPWSIGPALMQVALEYNSDGSAKNALVELDRLSKRFSQNVEPLKRAIFLIENSNDLEIDKKNEKVFLLYKELSDREPKNVLILVKAGLSAEALDRLKDAEQFFRKAVEIEPHCARALVYLASYEKRAGNIEEMHKYVRLALASQEAAETYEGYAFDVLSLDLPARQRLATLR